MTATNPGQFYYNSFYSVGMPGDTVAMNIEIPYPFVTHGSNPIHVYSLFEITGQPGTFCLTPIDDISSDFVIRTDGGNPSSSGHDTIVLATGDNHNRRRATITVTGLVLRRGPPISSTAR
jgi:hypothetical protein